MTTTVMLAFMLVLTLMLMLLVLFRMCHIVLGDIKSIAIYAMCRSNLFNKSCLQATGCECVCVCVFRSMVSNTMCSFVRECECVIVSYKRKLHVRGTAQSTLWFQIFFPWFGDHNFLPIHALSLSFSRFHTHIGIVCALVSDCVCVLWIASNCASSSIDTNRL